MFEVVNFYDALAPWYHLVYQDWEDRLRGSALLEYREPRIHRDQSVGRLGMCEGKIDGNAAAHGKPRMKACPI